MFTKIDYHEAIKQVNNGKIVAILPEGANPNYLTNKYVKINPMARGLDNRRNDGKKLTYKEIVQNMKYIKDNVINTFQDEDNISHTKVCYYLLD